MDYSYYLKLRNSSLLKFSDILDANYKVSSLSSYIFDKTKEATYSVTDASRFNSNYLPYQSQLSNYYNSSSSALGDSLRGLGLIVNAFDDSFCSSGYRLSNVLDQFVQGNSTYSGKITYTTLTSSGNSIFMDQQNTDGNSTTGDNMISGDGTTGNLEGLGKVLFGGLTYDIKNCTMEGMISFTLNSSQTPLNPMDRVLLVARKMYEFDTKKFQFLQEDVVLDYSEFKQVKPFKYQIQLGRKEVLGFYFIGALYSSGYYIQKPVGNDTVEEDQPTLTLNSYQVYFTGV